MRFSFVVLVISWLSSASASADVFRWNDGEMITGTEGIEVGPGVNLDSMNLDYADLSGVDLTGASFRNSNLSNAKLHDAILTSADLTYADLSKAVLAHANLRGAILANADVSGANFEMADLRDADITAARFVFTNVADANFTGARITHASIGGGRFLLNGNNQSTISAEQFQSTASYDEGDLRGITFGHFFGSIPDLREWGFANKSLAYAEINYSDLTDADFQGANLSGLAITYSTLGNTDLRGAVIKNADFREGRAEDIIVDENTIYDEWTLFPEGFDPMTSDATFAAAVLGDFDSNDEFDIFDLELLGEKVNLYADQGVFMRINDRVFDLNLDDFVDDEDLEVWVEEIANTWFGDSNLDGEFNSADFVTVFQANEYEDTIGRNSTWSTGDWNGDGDFGSEDFVLAFRQGGYEKGQRPPVQAVPEPRVPFPLLALPAMAQRRRMCSRGRK